MGKKSYFCQVVVFNKKKNPKQNTRSRSTDSINSLEKIQLLLFYLEGKQLDLVLVFFQLILSNLDNLFSLDKSCGTR